MDNGFSILMLISGAAVMLYAAILSSGNYKLLPLTVQPSLRRKDKKGQTKHIAAVTAVVASPYFIRIYHYFAFYVFIKDNREQLIKPFPMFLYLKIYS